MIDVKEAVAAALEFLREVFGELPGVALEEVELADAGRVWRITVGFERSAPPRHALDVGVPGRMERVYKVVVIDAESGEYRAIKMRDDAA